MWYLLKVLPRESSSVEIPFIIALGTSLFFFTGNPCVCPKVMSTINWKYTLKLLSAGFIGPVVSVEAAASGCLKNCWILSL